MYCIVTKCLFHLSLKKGAMKAKCSVPKCLGTSLSSWNSLFLFKGIIYIYYDSLFMDRACTTIKIERHLEYCLGIHPGPWDTAQKILNGRLEKLAQSVKNCHRTKHSLVLLHRFPTIYFKPKGGSPKKYQVSSWFANFRVYWNHVKLMTSTFSHCFNW